MGTDPASDCGSVNAPGISQSTLIAGSIVFAFIVFITMRGSLSKYLAILV
jgi:hypothetical protein